MVGGAEIWTIVHHFVQEADIVLDLGARTLTEPHRHWHTYE